MPSPSTAASVLLPVFVPANVSVHPHSDCAEVLRTADAHLYSLYLPHEARGHGDLSLRIGRWTAEMLLIFNLLRPDVLPLDDLGLQRGVSLGYRNGRKVSASGIRRISRTWAPWRSVATWYLWRSLDPLPVEY